MFLLLSYIQTRGSQTGHRNALVRWFEIARASVAWYLTPFKFNYGFHNFLWGKFLRPSSRISELNVSSPLYSQCTSGWTRPWAPPLKKSWIRLCCMFIKEWNLYKLYNNSNNSHKTDNWWKLIQIFVCISGVDNKRAAAVLVHEEFVTTQAMQNQSQNAPKLQFSLTNSPCLPLCGKSYIWPRARLHDSKIVCTVRIVQ